MAQGNLKLKPKGPGRVTKKQKNPKKAAPKIIKPKKASAKEASKLSKAQLTQLITSTEKLIASRVGHLELVQGSRRQVEKSLKKGEKQKK